MLRKGSRNPKTRCERSKLDIKPGSTVRLQEVVDMRYHKIHILSRRKREEEDTTAMQDADPRGEMTAGLGTNSDAMNVEMVDFWEDVVNTQQEQEVLKHIDENFVGSEADDDGGWMGLGRRAREVLGLVKGAGSSTGRNRLHEVEGHLDRGGQGRVLQQDWQEASFCEMGGYAQRSG